MPYDFVVMILGLLSSFILFSEFPLLKKKETINSQYKLSIVIPARNEEKNIGLLLQDLMNQTINIHEIMCVDDGSTDETYKVASSFGVHTIFIKDKPSDWTGKAWACQMGAESATGDLILFLDADVRLSPNAISNLINAYDENKCVVSVQPYHQTKKYYEQFSFFFNLIQISGNGMSVRWLNQNVGLYGPVILINKDTYASIDGHSAAQKTIVDDLALGQKLKQMGFPFKLFMGGKNISYRMYGNNFKSLFEGWVKNYATGASKTPLLILGLVFLWVTSSISSVILLVQSILSMNILTIILASVFYLFWVFELFRLSDKVGHFKKTTVIFFPIYLAFFIVVFFISLFKKLFHNDVIWKDRKIKLDQ